MATQREFQHNNFGCDHDTIDLMARTIATLPHMCYCQICGYANNMCGVCVCLCVCVCTCMCVCSQNGWTALHLVAIEGRVDVVKLLTQARAQLDIQSEVLKFFYCLFHISASDSDNYDKLS